MKGLLSLSNVVIIFVDEVVISIIVIIIAAAKIVVKVVVFALSLKQRKNTIDRIKEKRN